MNHRGKVFCVLCKLSKETRATGALSTKDQVTAHQNCLLFSSGLYCTDSPQFDDLFGFSVENVKNEVKRGRKLTCNTCRKKGATVGCEVKRCKKSYHYPCAIEEGAKTIEDADMEKYVLYCSNHHLQLQTTQNNGSVNEHPSTTSKNGSKAGSSKVCCLACEKTGGNISLEILSNSTVMLYCDKHAPSKYKVNTNDDSTAAGPSAYSSDSNSSSSATRSKRRLSFSDKQEEVPSKCKSRGWKRRISDGSSNSDENEPNREMEIFAPIESDLDESANSVTENQFIRKDTGSPTQSTPGNQLESRDGNKDEDETIIYSDADSESLLLDVKTGKEPQSLPTSPEHLSQIASTADPKVILIKAIDVGKTKDGGSSPEQRPVHSPDQHTAGPCVPQQSSIGRPPSPDHSKPRSVTGSPPCTSSAIFPAPPETICVSLLSSSPSPSPVALPSEPEPSIDSTSFWKSCNAAGCTQAIFTDFINEMNDISSRIHSDQASQEDYDFALTVMAASGKLAELVAKQQKELQRKERELAKAAAAMKEVISALTK